MSKKYALKFWFIFWGISIVFLSAWFLYWNIRNHGVSAVVAGVMSVLPIDENDKNGYQALASIGDFMLSSGGQEKTFLVLFQNNLEIRPGGGFVGAFAIVKTKNASVLSMETHDLSNFDARIPNDIEPPYPMKEIGYVDSWKMRDSNFSPNFETNAKKAEEFYHLGQGEQQFDGVIAVTANMLTSMLRVTGPIKIDGYPGTYDSENAIISLEYQVEKAFEQQGIDREQRKSVMNDLAKEIERKVVILSGQKKIQLAKILLEDLNRKDIQLYFKDEALQDVVKKAQWSGAVDQNWNKDYLMMVDANLGAFKSDYYVKRSADYTVDLSGENPIAHLKITYQHTANQKDWMTRNYLTYLRIYVPDGSNFIDGANFDNPQIGSEFGKEYFGALVRVPLGTSKTVEINYTLEQSVKDGWDLKIQKQAGLDNIPISAHIIKKDGSKKDFNITLNRDEIITN